MNKLQAMEVFVQVVDAGSFTRAADNLQLPKATVSTLVQSLEQALQVKLLHRTTRQISVTADGAAYYERCLRILNDVRDAEEALSRNRASPSGRLRVDVSTGVANWLLLPALPTFFERYPDIVLDLGCGDRPVDLIEEGVDCAVRGGNLDDSSLIARRVGVVEFITCATPSYLRRHGRPAHPSELAAPHHCVGYFSPKTGETHEWEFTRAEETLSIKPGGNLRVNDATAYLRAALNGLGIAHLSTFAAAPHLRSGDLVQLLPEWRSAPMPVQVVYPHNRHLSAKVRVFVEWVAELFAQYPLLQMSQAPATPIAQLQRA
jgi:LysR family transcriptional regulator for bpeEF and oprC